MFCSTSSNVSIEPLRFEEFEHGSQLLDSPEHTLSSDVPRSRRVSTRLLPKHLIHLTIRKLVSSQTHRTIPVSARLPERLGCKVPNVYSRDELQCRGAGNADFEHARKPLPERIGREVLHESHAAQDGVGHIRALGPLDEMLLYLVLGGKVRDVGRVVDAVVSVAVDGGVDKVLHAMSEGGVDQGFALVLFLRAVWAEEGYWWDLHGEDAVDVGVEGLGGCEDGGDVVEVAGHELDVGGAGG